jgi:hypothetical protein
VKPGLKAWKSEEWERYVPLVNDAAFVLGVSFGVPTFGLLYGWDAVNLFLGGVSGLFAAATALGIYGAARSNVNRS